jgi:hypothetical protein
MAQKFEPWTDIDFVQGNPVGLVVILRRRTGSESALDGIEQSILVTGESTSRFLA